MVIRTMSGLRGHLVTDNNGAVHFDSIIPGWYLGRCPHIHIDTFFPPAMGDNNQTIHMKSFKNKPVYIDNPHKMLPNEQDNVFIREQGGKLIMDIRPASQNPEKDGYVAKMILGIELPNKSADKSC